MILLPLGVLGTGMFNTAATKEPGTLERRLASLALNRSVAARAPDSENPFRDDQTAIEHGITHFRETCLLCHGAPNVEPGEFAKGLNPAAPELSQVLADWSDGDLFWLTSHGIRMTGMPAFGTTHSDEEIWQIVAFVRHLPNLTPGQKKVLQEASQQGHHHGGPEHKQNEHEEGAAQEEHEHGESKQGS